MIRSDYRQPIAMHQHAGALRLPPTFPFVGRSTELGMLRALLPLATDGRGRVVLLGGEPGSGKSRLARELADAAAGEGVLVLAGTCDAVVPTPYGPVVEALDQLARAVDPGVLRDALGPGGGELTRLLPDLPGRVGPLPAPVTADPDTERHRLHTTVRSLLVEVSRRRPLLLVLEDAHWADAPTLLLLRYLARAAGEARMLVVTTFRDAEADVPRALAETLADLRRSDDAVRVRLSGLSGEDVRELVQRAAGEAAGAAPRELARTIVDLTGGNPFLVCELWRALVETAAVEVTDGAVRLRRAVSDLGTPESVREVVSERVARLAPETAQLLELAAVAGREFGLDVVRRAAGDADPDLAAHLDEAVRSGMVEELASRALAFRFTHELVRRALYDRLSGLRRAELHLRVGEALEAGAERSGRTLADLAHHFTAAAPVAGPARAVDYNLQAARAAMGALAFDDAVARLRTALELHIDDPRRRVEALLALGTAAHRAGKAGDAHDAFALAAGIARDLGAPALLAEAAIGYETACWRPGIVDKGAVELLEEATPAAGASDPELRVRLLGSLARALEIRGDRERAAVARREAIDLARRLPDRAALAGVLAAAYWSRGTRSWEEILAMLTEAMGIGAQLGNTEILADAMSWRVPTFVALGDLDAARTELAALEQIAERTAQPFVLHVAAQYGSAIALSDGRLDDADALAQRSRDWSRLLTGRDASGVHGIQMFGVRREQGRLGELAPLLGVLAAGAGGASWRPGLASLLVELGMLDDARRELERVRADGLDALRESPWLASLAYLADAASALGDEATAALVYPELEPQAGGIVLIGHLVSCYGAADRYLGMLAATLGAWDRAEEHFAVATDLNRRTGMQTWLGHTLYQRARARLARGDGEGAAPLLDEAAAIAEDARLPALLARVRAVGSSAPALLPDGLSSREVEILELVARGLSNRDIGGTLFISEHTAANHVRSILRKTGCVNRTEAASYAYRHGLVEA